MTRPNDISQAIWDILGEEEMTELLSRLKSSLNYVNSIYFDKNGDPSDDFGMDADNLTQDLLDAIREIQNHPSALSDAYARGLEDAANHCATQAEALYVDYNDKAGMYLLEDTAAAIRALGSK